MSIEITCADCQRQFKVKDRYAGMAGACPFCGNMLLVPDVDEPDGDTASADDLVIGRKLKATSETPSSLSLMTRVPLTHCTSCNKEVLVGADSCIHCGAALPAPDSSTNILQTGEQIVRQQIQRLMAQNSPPNAEDGS